MIMILACPIILLKHLSFCNEHPNGYLFTLTTCKRNALSVTLNVQSGHFCSEFSSPYTLTSRHNKKITQYISVSFFEGKVATCE